MSDELKLKLVFDSSDAEKAAQALPDAVDRANRKGRKSWEGGGAPVGSSADYRKTAGMGKEVEEQNRKNAEQQKKESDAAYRRNVRFNSAVAQDQQRNDDKEQRRKNAEYNRNLRFNSGIEADNNRRQEQEQRRQNAEYVRRMRFNSGVEADNNRRQEQEQRRQNAEYVRRLRYNSQLEADEQRRKDKEGKLSNAEYLRRLRYNSRIQEEQDKAASNVKTWGDEFGKALEGTLMRSIGPAAVAAKAIEVGWGQVINMAKGWYGAYESKITAGVDPAQLRAFEMFANVGTADNDQVRAMAERAQGNVNALATGAPGGNAYGFQYFGMTDYQRYRKEGLPIAELLTAMSRRFKDEGGSAAYGEAMKSIFGDEWTTIRPLLALDSSMQRPGMVMEEIESWPTMSLQYGQAKFYKAMAMAMSNQELMGGTKGIPNQMLSNVTSLQAMGGGDILSAIARGPQDQIVSNTAQIAANTARMANQTAPNNQPPPARLGP